MEHKNMEYLSQLITSQDTVKSWNVKRADILERISAYIDPCVARPDIIAEQDIEINKVYKLLGAEKNFAQYFHGDGHDSVPMTRDLAYSWFDEHFKYGE